MIRTLKRFVALMLVASVALPVHAGSLTPPGAPAPTMVTLDQLNTGIAAAQDTRTPVDTLPGNGSAVQEISAPGNYYLRADVVGVAGLNGIEIAADDVSLDLNGFSVRGVAGAGHGINSPGPMDRHRLVLRNGKIRNWPGQGIIAGSGAALFHSCRFENLEVSACTNGITTVRTSMLTNVIAANNSGFGFSMTGCDLSHCIARSNGGVGFAGTGQFTSCVAESNSGNGFGINDSLLVNCTSAANGGDGISATFRAQILDCAAGSNSGHGINVTAQGNVVRGCLVTANGLAAGTQSGIRVSGTRSVIDGNVVANNFEEGINVTGTTNLIVRNQARSNTTNYAFAASNSDAQVITPGAAFVSTDPWANFAF